jgi:hypothetical protein
MIDGVKTLIDIYSRPAGHSLDAIYKGPMRCVVNRLVVDLLEIPDAQLALLVPRNHQVIFPGVELECGNPSTVQL